MATASVLGTAGSAVAGACIATGVAAAAGVDPTAWALAWGAGGHVRPWRPTQVLRGRAPYLEWAVGNADFGNNSYKEGGLARLSIKLACIARTSDHGEAEKVTAAILLTALDSIRLLGGGFAGTGDQVGELVKIAGYSDCWRREATIECTLDYDYKARATDPGATSITTTSQGFQTSLTVNFGDSTQSVAIPSGFTVSSVTTLPTIAWNGTGASVAVYLDPDATPLMTLVAADLNELTLARQAQGAITGCTALRVVPTPGIGATTGQVLVSLTATSP